MVGFLAEQLITRDDAEYMLTSHVQPGQMLQISRPLRREREITTL